MFTASPGLHRKYASFVVAALACMATFTTYFCMYAYRKPVTAATFDGITAFGISFKSALVVAQVLGYMTSKFIGIRFIAELDKTKRSRHILILIGSAHLSLLLLALVPAPYNVLFLFTNGMSLGLIWGLVFSYIEGRKFTDFVALVLSNNFVFSSGVVKTIGRIFIEQWKVPELYMPFAVGLIFFPLLLLATWMLERIPAPSDEEENGKGKRSPLNAQERAALIKQFFIGLTAIIIINLVCTILRDLKDNYAVEMIRSVKPQFNPGIFARMETIAAFAVFVLLLLLTIFKSHFRSIFAHHVAIFLGFTLVITAGYLIRYNIVDPVPALILSTVGLYVCYDTLQCLFLDRFISAFKVKGNIGFFFYLMDSIGYLGSCFIIMGKEVFTPELNWLPFFIKASYVMGSVGLVCIFISAFYFYKKYKSATATIESKLHAFPTF